MQLQSVIVILAAKAVYDHDKLKEVSTNVRHWRTSGNSNMATQTWSTYISESMTDIVKIPTKSGIIDRGELDKSVAKWLRVFVTRPITENGKVAAKTGNIYICGSKFQRQI